MESKDDKTIPVKANSPETTKTEDDTIMIHSDQAVSHFRTTYGPPGMSNDLVPVSSTALLIC